MLQESKRNDYSLHLTCVAYLCNEKRMIKQWAYLRWTWSVKLMSCTLQKGSNIFLARFKNYGIWIFLKVSDFLVANYRKCPVFFNSFDTWQAHMYTLQPGRGRKLLYAGYNFSQICFTSTLFKAISFFHTFYCSAQTSNAHTSKRLNGSDVVWKEVSRLDQRLVCSSTQRNLKEPQSLQEMETVNLSI